MHMFQRTSQKLLVLFVTGSLVLRCAPSIVGEMVKLSNYRRVVPRPAAAFS